MERRFLREKKRELLLRPFSSIKGGGTYSLFLQGRKEGTHGNCSTRESGEEGLPPILPPKIEKARDCSACRDRILRYPLDIYLCVDR